MEYLTAFFYVGGLFATDIKSRWDSRTGRRDSVQREEIAFRRASVQCEEIAFSVQRTEEQAYSGQRFKRSACSVQMNRMSWRH